MIRVQSGIAATAAAVLAGLGAQPLAAAAVPGGIEATWEMNETAGATTMSDSSGNGIHGTIGNAVQTGFVYGGATGYRWSKTNPNEPPAKPERLVVVNDARLNPGYNDFSLTMRFRTTHSAGNMLQKGQATNQGGYFKWQNVRGKVTCLIRGYDEQGNVLSKAVNTGETPLNDGAWHTLTCARTADRVTLTIDGSRVRRALGPTGSISNNVPLTLAGKPNCDQITVTCDYFSGEMDYLRFSSDGSATGGSGSADTTAPTVTSRSPGAEAVGVARGVNVRATFDEPVTGVSASTMTLRKASTGALVAATVTYDASKRQGILDPGTYLAPNSRYVVAMDSGITDAAGNPLQPMTWSFTTAG